MEPAAVGPRAVQRGPLSGSRAGDPEVHQVLATLGYGDAIGNEALAIQRLLRGAGFRSEIFVETAQPRVAACTRDYRELPRFSSPANLLIHHFSIGSRASRTAFALPDRMLLVYHNVTPARYFLDVNDALAERCYRGRRELSAYVTRVRLAVGASEFNRAELERMGFAPTAVLPPLVPDFNHLEVEPDHVTEAAFGDDVVNILFVGRIVPNKRIEDLVRIFKAYSTLFNARARLIVVGSWDGFEAYYGMLQEFVAREGVERVYFAGHVTNEQLTAFYDVADVFLCASEHEGFCVPLVESFYKDVPVVAFAAAAVPATLDGGGLLYDTKDPVTVAGLVDAVVSDDRLRSSVLASQRAALARLMQKDFRALLLGYVERALAG
ncbi:MAG: glycosyltransferase [Bacteroidales bacterium]